MWELSDLTHWNQFNHLTACKQKMFGLLAILASLKSTRQILIY